MINNVGVGVAAAIVKPTREGSDQQGADWLRRCIIDGVYKSGQRLTETGLADEVGLSRSTMRTALLHLQSEGLVDRTAYSAWRVAALSADDARDVYELRAAIEGLAARRAARRPDYLTLDDLSSALDTLTSAVRARADAATVAAADMEFHAQIALLSNNKRLIAQYDRLRGIIHFYVRAVSMRATPKALIGEHTAIFDAIDKRDPGLAERLAIQHVETHGQRLENELWQESAQLHP